MEKNFRKNQHKDSGIVNHVQMTGTTTEKRIDVWANSQPIGLAIERLQEIFKQGINQRMLFIRFEDLTRNPAEQMKRIYDFFGVSNYAHDFDNVTQLTVEDDSVYGIYGDHSIRTKVEPVKSIAKDILGSNVCNWILSRYEWYFKEFYK
jgi:sulfotransferase